MNSSKKSRKEERQKSKENGNKIKRVKFGDREKNEKYEGKERGKEGKERGKKGRVGKQRRRNKRRLEGGTREEGRKKNGDKMRLIDKEQ